MKRALAALLAIASLGWNNDVAACPTVGPSIDPISDQDFYCLRMLHLALRKENDLVEADALGRALAAARAAGDGPAASGSAIALLDLDPTDIEAHLERARALDRVDPAQATWHEARARGLLDSLLRGGAGRDEGNPVRVTSRREQAAVLAALDVRPRRRRDVATGGVTRHVIEGITHGRPRAIWFELVTQWSPGASCPDLATYSR